MLLKKTKGYLLVEFVVALVLSIVVLMQLTGFLLAFVMQVNKVSDNASRGLQEAVVLDILLDDCASALTFSASSASSEANGIFMVCWRLKEHEEPAQQVITWLYADDNLKRKSDKNPAAQYFGKLLVDLRVDCASKTMEFTDVYGQKKSVPFASAQ